MTELTRRPRNVEGRFISWEIFHGDVGIGLIQERSGVPRHVDHWQWSCGFYPGCDIRTQVASGTAATYDAARAAFMKAWENLDPQVTPEMRERWLYEQAFTAWKYAMWDAGCLMPTQKAEGRSRCFCGAEITIGNTDEHILQVHVKVGADV